MPGPLQVSALTAGDTVRLRTLQRSHAVGRNLPLRRQCMFARRLTTCAVPVFPAAAQPFLGPGVTRRGRRKSPAGAHLLQPAAAAPAACRQQPLKAPLHLLLRQDKREHAAKALVEELVKSQKEFEDEQSSEGSDEEEEEERDQAGGGKGSSVDTALRRCSPLMVRVHVTSG